MMGKDNRNDKAKGQAASWGEGFAWEVIEALGQGATILDADGRFEYVNPAYGQMVGRLPKELIGLSPFDVTHPDDHEKLHRARQQRWSGERSTYETRLMRPDGTTVYAHITGVPHREGDRVVGSFTIVTDLTEQKQDEEKLRQSEARYRSVVEDIPGLLCRFKPGGVLEFVNEAYARTFGRQPQELIGRSFLSLIPEENRAAVMADLDALSPESPVMTHEHPVIVAGGEVRWQRWTNRLLTDVAGQPIAYQAFGLDITEQKQVEEALRQEKVFIDAIIDSLPGAFYLFDQEGHFLRWNKNMEQLTGYTAEEVTGLQPLDLIHPADGEQVAAAIQKAFSEGEAVVEAHMLTKGGQTIPYFFTGRRVLLQEQPAIIGLGIDITERKQAEEKLRRSEANLRAIFNNTLQAFVLFDASRRVLAANPVANNWAKQTLGRPLKEGELADELFAQFQFGNFRQAFGRALQGETVIQQRKITVADQSFWFETNYNPVTTDAGDVVGVSLSVLNITERKQVEEALRQSKTEFQHIIDTVPEGVLLLDANGRITLANPLAEQYLTILAPDWEDGRLTHLGQWPLNQLLTSPPKGLWHEITLEQYAFEAIARPVEHNPNNTGWVLVLRDVTQERDIQRRLQRQDRLAAVGQLAAGIAHDFNNILAVITLYAQLISRMAKMPPRLQEKLKTIEHQAQRATDLIQQILDFSRQSVLERQPVDLLPFMKELCKLLERTLPEHIQIELSHARETYIIHADPARIQQVMMNLAVNARDAMPEGGQLHIRLAQVQTEKPKLLPLRDMPPGDWIQIEVTDSGSGIPPEVLPHIFEPFFTTKAVGKGTGLGLAQVYGIMQQHDGYIDITIEEKQGTTFSLYFPLLDAGQKRVTTLDSASLQPGQGQTVLLVEDDRVTRQALVDSLTLLNYEVIEATNGREALTILTTKASDIDLVLSDVVMPEMGGAALLHALRQQEMAIPVVLLTGHPLSGEMANLQALGLAGWLPKPPDLISLSNLLAQALPT